MKNKNQIAIIGGAGHIGAPLGINLSHVGYKSILIDLNKANINLINSGKMPFVEKGAEKILKKQLKKKKIFASSKLDLVKSCKYIIVCIGTPVSSKNIPLKKDFINFFKKIKKYLDKDHIIIIRSSVYPGTLNEVYNILKSKCINLSYCPERIAQGYSLIEQKKIAQIVSGFNKNAIVESSKLFKKISGKIIVSKIEEAEMIKLFSNAYRYSHFSISNLFYMMCVKKNLNFSKIRNLMMTQYGRNNSLPNSGFVSGPCLYKDTMQLSHYFKNKFEILRNIKNINEGLPIFILKKLTEKYNLKKKRIGILGVTFKPENDDIRDSLPMKLIKHLKVKKLDVIYSDDYYQNRETCDKKYLINNSDIIIIGTTHNSYKKLKFKKKQIIIDIGGFFED